MVLPAIFRFLAVNRILTIVCGTSKASSVFFFAKARIFVLTVKVLGFLRLVASFVWWYGRDYYCVSM